MNANSVPQILTDQSLFDSCALEAARHVMKQPPYIRKPIAAYGACVAEAIPAGREVLVDSMHAMSRAQIHRWTAQVSDYPDDLDRLEDAIAHNVHLAHVALTLNEIEQS